MQKDYAVTQKVIHWLMGIFIMLDLFIAQKFGIVTASAASQPIMLFGVFDAAFVTADEGFFLAVRQIRELCTNLIIALIVIHIVAALYHHFIARGTTTTRMLRFWRRVQS